MHPGCLDRVKPRYAAVLPHNNTLRAPDSTLAAEFLERVELRYDEAARAAGVYVGGAFGFDSVPGDLGVQARREGC